MSPADRDESNSDNDPGFIIVCGPPAVGKITVAKAIAARNGYKVLHNHVSIESALAYFPFGTPGFRTISESVRKAVLAAVAESDLLGLIFTFVWALRHG
jgi:hypothetical protein